MYRQRQRSGRPDAQLFERHGECAEHVFFVGAILPAHAHTMTMATTFDPQIEGWGQKYHV